MQKLTVIGWPIVDLRARETQQRSEATALKVVALIEKYGFQIPVLLSAEGELVSGEIRVRAAELMGLKEVPAVVAEGWTISQFEAFDRLAKKSSSWASWSLEAVTEELIEARADDFDFEWLDFDDQWMTALIDDFFGKDEPGDKDAVEAKPAAKRKTKTARKVAR